MEEEKIGVESVKRSPIITGNCHFCQRGHSFPGSYSRELGYSLMEEMENKEISRGPLSLTLLFGEMRGKMFGVMKCLTRDKSIVILKAFSGQYNGCRQSPDWAPPLFDIAEWNRVNSPVEQRIKDIGKIIETCSSSERQQLIKKRKNLSQILMKDLHALYRLTNFSGKTFTFSDIFPEGYGIPTGTGDCCLPKLLNFAATHHLIPVEFCEFYWGRENRSGTKKHRRFYLPCREKCLPLMGSMLCGLEEMYEKYRL